MKIKKYLIGAFLLGVIVSGCTSSSAESSSPAPGPKPRVRPLEVTIEMSEYAFTPANIEAEVGQEVTLTLVNVGELEHELMIGKNVEMHDGVPAGYEVDLFRTADIIPTVHGNGMLMAHGEDGHQDEADMDMEGDNHEEGMDMDEEGDDHEDMDMDEEGDDHEDMDMNLEGDGALMVMMPVSSESTTVTFTVTEEMIGDWEMGCFQLDGVHYNGGMVGTFTVKE